MHNKEQITFQLPDIQDQKLLTIHWHSFSRSAREHVAFSLAYNGGQYSTDVLQRLNHSSITCLTGLKMVDALLTLIFRMGQPGCHFLFWVEIQPIPHWWLSASNCHLDYPRCKSKNHWHAVDYHVQDGAGSVSLLILFIKAADSLKKDNDVPKTMFCDLQ